MTIRVTITKTLEDWLGAEDYLAYGGEVALKEGLLEDANSLLEGATWAFEEVADVARCAAQEPAE